jgi:uracil-DNA glycosylase
MSRRAAPQPSEPSRHVPARSVVPGAAKAESTVAGVTALPAGDLASDPVHERFTPNETLARDLAADLTLADVASRIVACRACPRLVEWRERTGREKVARFAGWTYWARPVPGYGDPSARIAVVGLAPAAHGGNRTGRVFTGDRSGDLLFAAMFRAGLANQPTSTSVDDGLALRDAYVTAAVRCAPPRNRPLPSERDRCLPYVVRELQLLEDVRTIVALGAFGWDASLRALAALGHPVRPRPRFGHGAHASVGAYHLLGCFHPSQQNTFTGRLTPAMVDDVLREARRLAGLGPLPPAGPDLAVTP